MGCCRSNGSRATSHQSWKSKKKILPSGPVRTLFARAKLFFKPTTLIAGSSAALWPTETHSTSFERSKPLLLTQYLSKSLEALSIYFISVQSTLISIGLISKCAVFVGPICILDGEKGLKKTWKFGIRTRDPNLSKTPLNICLHSIEWLSYFVEL